MDLFLAMILIVSGVKEIPADVQEAANKIVEAGSYKLGTRNGLMSCEITSTTGYASLDERLCRNAVECAGRYKSDDKRAACVAAKRKELSASIAKVLAKKK